MKKNKIQFIILILGIVILGMTLGLGVLAQTPQQESSIYTEIIKDKLDDAQAIGLPGSEGYNMTFLDRAAMMVNRSLSFLGLLFLIIIIVAGVKWMTSGGSEDKINQAKKMLTAGIVGIAIVFFAFGISAFVFNVMFSDYWGN